MANYKKGQILEGYVSGIEKYGIFVNLDQFYNGLIHISEISDNYVKRIEDFVSIGETINVKVLDVDEINHQLKLSIKNIQYRKRKSKRMKIIETKKGFGSLSEKLNFWIKEELKKLK